ncbi:MAG: flagellar motor protein [Clostridia bacterium]|nr:flagellar motor protein [Clostridia bacterium]
MDIGSIIGLIVGFAGILTGFLIEAKFNFAALGSLIQPPAIAIVFGGTIGAVLFSFPLEEVKKLGAALKLIFGKVEHDEVGIINQMIGLAEKSRKEGLLSLEQDAQTITNPLIKKGLSLVVDGIEPQAVRDILDVDIELREKMNEGSIKIFEAAGGYSPTMGVIGTVMGMVNILGELGGADMEKLGKSIAVAFIATFYGVLFANILYLPAAGRLKSKVEHERMINELIVEGILSIQHGENPRIIREKLNLAMFERLKGMEPSAEKADKE